MTATPDLFDGFAPAYPATPGFKGRDTSRVAAAAIAPIAKTLRDRALATIVASGQHGLTADQVAARLGKSIMSIRPRISELVELGKLRDTGHRRKNDSGKSAVVWQAL
jgi:hypothetical protein